MASPTLDVPQSLPQGVPASMCGLKKQSDAPGLDFVAEFPTPTIGPNDVLIRVTHAGVCGTDRHIYEWDQWAQSRVPIGLTTGHEFVGEAVAVGEGCQLVSPGDRLSCECHISCGQCFACRTGEPHICHYVDILGVDRDGCFAQYISVPECNCWKMPAGIPDKYAAIFDPLGNAMHTVMAAGVSGKSVLITGVGIIGLMAVSIAKSAGALRIFVTDMDQRRLDIARQLGADETFKATDEGWAKAVRANTRGVGADVLLEMSGNGQAMKQGLEAMRNGGTAALLGLPGQPFAIDWANHVIFKGATLLGINGRKMFETWYQVERFLLDKKINLDPILTHVLPLEKYNDAFSLMQSGDGIKIVLQIPQES